jgi:hypothetical protein
LVLGCHRNWVLISSPFGNPLGFGFYLDSILNALGMILLSGMFKDVPVGVPSFASRFASSVKGAKKQTSVQPVVVSFIPNSQASSTYDPTEYAPPGLVYKPNPKALALDIDSGGLPLLKHASSGYLRFPARSIITMTTMGNIIYIYIYIYIYICDI